MSNAETPPSDPAGLFTEMLRIQGETARQAMDAMLPDGDSASTEARQEWTDAVRKLQRMWLEFHEQQAIAQVPVPLFADPAQWFGMMQGWYQTVPMLDPGRQAQIWQDGVKLWQDILQQYGAGGTGSEGGAALPRSDRRFADPAWRDQPVYALIHQTYLLLAERISEAVDAVSGLSPADREELRFATRTVLDAMSPANFPLMNPVVLERTLETRGENLATGMRRLAHDLEQGQLTHTDSDAFKLGENIATTPGFVVHETELYQLIQYSPSTETVLSVPLVIFPPWINRYYILDLNPKKSFVKWALDQGVTVFVVSWRSADASLAHIEWDDYIRAELDAMTFIRERLQVPAVHAMGYCVAGTTLAAALAILARRGHQDSVKSATFLTAQVDFEHAGDLKVFTGDSHLEMIRQASKGGFLDGRYMAATFNLLRGGDLIWNYVVNHYLLGEDYPAFDMLHWNGDVTNLPARWHELYLRDLYRDNLLVVPDRLEADGTPIDLRLVTTPAYIQAGREDHIAPPESVFKMIGHLSGPTTFVLAGSGHIAGVVNPPAQNKYQYWTGPSDAASLDDFLAKAKERPGSWWTDWLRWLEGQDGARIPATGKRLPGSEGDKVIESSPGRYAATR